MKCLKMQLIHSLLSLMGIVVVTTIQLDNRDLYCIDNDKLNQVIQTDTFHLGTLLNFNLDLYKIKGSFSSYFCTQNLYDELYSKLLKSLYFMKMKVSSLHNAISTDDTVQLICILLMLIWYYAYKNRYVLYPKLIFINSFSFTHQRVKWTQGWHRLDGNFHFRSSSCSNNMKIISSAFPTSRRASMNNNASMSLDSMIPKGSPRKRRDSLFE